jgi:hypothetical protein
MTEYFPHVRGSFSIYVGGRDDAIDTVRFVLGFFGEDPAKIVEAFWKEHRGDFTVIPLFAHGNAAVPRRELCTQKSLVDALQSVVIEPGSMTEQKWRLLCEQMNVSWPKRLQGKAA